MKKIKFSLMFVAVIIAVTSAFATQKTAFDCTYQQQYYYNGSGYTPLGEIGVDYDCDWDDLVTCTYYKPFPFSQPFYYVACRKGDYIDIP